MVLRLIFSQQPLWKILIFCHLYSAVRRHSVIASDCAGGRDVFAKVKENSLMGTFIANLSFTAHPSANHKHLKLSGKDAGWFYLEGRTVRLNSTSARIIDRETHGPVLTAVVRCYEHKALQAEHRIMVEVLNENDNKPEFLQSSIQPVQLSELTAVNTVVFTVQATDGDGDTLTYVIDETSPDARYFRVDLPNSGKVFLNKSLDFEIKTQLRVTVYAVETNTKEHYNTTATIIINVTDGDDQYPQFQPCTLLSANHGNRICANPLYTANITENEQDVVLDFFPGPIQAVDGDEGLRTPVKYTILSGADNGRFVIDSNSGEVRLTRRVENRLLIPTLRLRVMAAQTDDPLKYAVATVLVRVLAENRFPPQFNRSTYRGFVTESSSPASLVMTYGNKLLILEATDQDFSDGFNPRLQYSLNSKHNSSRLFYITQEGLLIAKTTQLHPGHKCFLEVFATDLESGDIVKAALHVEVLQKDQSVPQGPLGAGHEYTRETVGRAEGVVGVCLILLLITLFTLVRCVRMSRRKRDQAVRDNVPDSTHPNVRLRWFKMVNHSGPMPLVEETFSYHNEAFSGYDCSTSPFYGKQGIYSKFEDPPPQSSSVNLPSITYNKCLKQPRRNYLALRPNGKPVNRFNKKTVTFQDYVVVRECDEEGNTDVMFTTEVEVCKDVEVNMDFEIINDESDEPEEEFKIHSPKITSSSDDESEIHSSHQSGVNQDSDISNELSDLDLSHANSLEIKHQNADGKQMMGKTHRDLNQEKNHAKTQNSTSEDATQSELSIFKEEPYFTNPKALVSNKPTVKHSESFASDGHIKSEDLNTDRLVSAESSVQNIQDACDQDTERQNITDLRTHLSTLTLDSGQCYGSEQCLDTSNTNTYYINEDISTNLDDSSPEEESVSYIETTPEHLHYLHETIEFFHKQLDDETTDDER